MVMVMISLTPIMVKWRLYLLDGDNFLVRALGLVPSIALGMAMGRLDRQVVLIDDDGWGKCSGQSVPATTLAM